MKSFFNRHLVAAAALALGLGLAQQTAGASFLHYGTTGSGAPGGGDTASSLFTIDPTTGVSTLVGATGFIGVNSIDFNPLTGVLYGIANNGGGVAQLITINPATGAGNLIAALSPNFQSPDMSFNPSGTLYSWSEASPDHLNRVNITTGATTDVGPSGIGTLHTGLDLNSVGAIYVKSGNNVYTINPVTGAATFLITVTAAATFENVLAFDPTDKLYTVDRRTGNSDLYTLNLTTGTSTLIGATGLPTLSALAFAPVVPEPATLSLLSVAVLVLWRRARV